MEKGFEKCGLLCLLFHVVISVNSPLSVTRGVLDSFRVDEFSCEADKDVCTRRNAFCQPDGSCLCRNNTPDYVKPILNMKYGYLNNGIIDGCISMEPVVDSIDPYNLGCSYSFRPYQLVPSGQQDKPIMFIHAAATHYSSCNFSNALIKYPGQPWVPLTWLNESHVDLNMTYVGVLLFGWRVPVPQLHGLMVIINLQCARIELNHIYNNHTISEQCLRMKVSGTTYFPGSGITRNYFPLLVFLGILVSFIVS